MIADRVPDGLVAQGFETRPASLHPDGDTVRQRVIHTGQHLEAEEIATDAAAQGTHRVRGAAGHRADVRVGDVRLQIVAIDAAEHVLVPLPDRDAPVVVAVAGADVRPADTGPDVRRPPRIVQKIVVGVQKKLVAVEIGQARGRRAGRPFAALVLRHGAAAGRGEQRGVARLVAVEILGFEAQSHVESVPRVDASGEPDARVKLGRVELPRVSVHTALRVVGVQGVVAGHRGEETFHASVENAVAARRVTDPGQRRVRGHRVREPQVEADVPAAAPVFRVRAPRGKGQHAAQRDDSARFQLPSGEWLFDLPL